MPTPYYIVMYTAIIAESKKDVNKILEIMKETIESELNIKINKMKTKILVFRRENNIRIRTRIKLKGDKIKEKN